MSIRLVSYPLFLASIMFDVGGRSGDLKNMFCISFTVQGVVKSVKIQSGVTGSVKFFVEVYDLEVYDLVDRPNKKL